MATAFVDNPDEVLYNEINHIDGNKTNNHWKNLEWVTHDMNMKHAYNLGMIYRPKGDSVYLTKISSSTVHKICQLFVKYQGRAESVYHEIHEIDPTVTLKMVQHIKHKECWSHISDQYWSCEDLNELQEIKIRTICEYLLTYNGDTHKTVEALQKIIPDINKRFVEIIKYKESYADISDEYFKFGQFDTRLSTKDIDTIRRKLFSTGMNVSETYESLKNSICNLTKKKVYKIKYKMIDEFKNGG